jgi:hypothetical protein
VKVIATVTRGDILRMNLHLFPRIKANWIMLAALVAFAFAFLIYDDRRPVAAAMLGSNLLWALFAGFCALLGSVLFCVIWVLAVANQKSGVLGEHEYEIRSDGLFEKTVANEGLNRWGGIQTISRSRDQIHVRVSAYLFHVIPKHSFRSDEDFDRYFEQLRHHWQAAGT